MDNKKRWILSTDTTNYLYEDYLEFCDCNGIEPAAENSTDFYDWCYEECQLDIEADMENIKCCTYKDRHFVITGALGLWDGRHTVRPVLCDSLYAAIDKCISGNSIQDFDVYKMDEESCITVEAHHHDGTNIFELHLLKEECYDDYLKAVDDYEYGDADEINIKSEWFEPVNFDLIF